MLDFASGFGRMLRFLSKRLPTDRVFASDLMRETTRFTQATFGVHSFPSAADPREIAFPRRFSAIWVGSLFTHLPPPSRTACSCSRRTRSTSPSRAATSSR